MERGRGDDLDDFIREQAEQSPDFALHLLNADMRAEVSTLRERLEEAETLLRRWDGHWHGYGVKSFDERHKDLAFDIRAFLSVDSKEGP